MLSEIWKKTLICLNSAGIYPYPDPMKLTASTSRVADDVLN